MAFILPLDMGVRPREVTLVSITQLSVRCAIGNVFTLLGDDRRQQFNTHTTFYFILTNPFFSEPEGTLESK